jgi:hypothetical protein
MSGPQPREAAGRARMDRASDLFNNQERSMELQLPQDGDVLVSNPTATVEHQICIVPKPPHASYRNHDRAVAEGRRLAEQLAVDAWLTEDQSHFIRIGHFRHDASRD